MNKEEIVVGALDKIDVERVQILLDGGMNRSKVAKKLGLHREYLNRLVSRGLVEIYCEFDSEEDTRHLAQNFEWLYEEDKLEEIFNEAYESEFTLIRNESNVDVGVYVRKTYGSLIQYFVNKGATYLLDHIYLECSKCNDVKPISDWYESVGSTWGMHSYCKSCKNGCQTKWRDENPLQTFVNSTRKRCDMAEALPMGFGKSEWVCMRNNFGWRDAYSNTLMNKPSVDHFIPVDTGHGGTFLENLLPTSRSMNSSKGKRNPFTWYTRKGVDEETFRKAVAYLAKQNGLTPKEYEGFVNWCFANPRNIDEVKRDQRHSIEIWREAVGVQFPLPKFAS